MFACIYIPDFPAEAIVRAQPWLRERAVSVLEGKPPLVRVIALNKKARLLGMEVGMTKLQASIFAGTSPSAAYLRQRSIEQENLAHSALLDVAHAFTPQVENTAPDTLLLDLTGLGRLYGTPAEMARDLASRVRAIELEANLALAANLDAAMHAARGFSGITVIPSGEEAQRLGVLPLQVLLDAFEISLALGARIPEREKLREQVLDTLERWGVRDFHALALLPESALASRLGEVGVRLQGLARGAGMRTLVLCAPASHFEEAMELESPVESLEPLSFVLNRLLEQLCARLEERALAVQELHLRLQLERWVADEETAMVGELTAPFVHSHNVGLPPFYTCVLRLPVSMRDTRIFLKLLQLELAAHPPGAPVTKVWITAEPAPPRMVQRGLFLPVTPETEKLEITLARISGIVGECRAGLVRLLDRHRPDSFRVDRFRVPADKPKPGKSLTMSDAGDQPSLALRILRPACRLQVRMLHGRPASLAAETKADRGELRGEIVWSVGPWRSSGDWWTEGEKGENSNHGQPGPWDREEWDIALTNGGASRSASDANMANSYDIPVALYRIYRDRGTGHWFADACYD
jgi:protein ImuB